MKVLWGILVAMVGFVPSQVDMESLIEQAMDQAVDFEIVEKPLTEAFAIVSEATGVPLYIAPEVARLLPYGADTRMTATMHQMSLREGLGRLLQPLGMRCRTMGDQVVVIPSDGLWRIGRRATWNELKTLEWLAGLTWRNDPADLEKLRALLQFQVPESDPTSLLFAEMSRAGAGPADEILTLACRELGWSWHPWGKTLALITAEEQAWRDLQRPVTLQVEHQPLAAVLEQLSAQSGLHVQIDPEVLETLPRETRENFSLLLVDATVQQALEAITKATKLRIDLHSGGVNLVSPMAEMTAASPAPAPSTDFANDPIVGRVSLPGPGGVYHFEFFIRESDLPPDVRAARQRLIDQAVEQMRRDASTTPQ